MHSANYGAVFVELVGAGNASPGAERRKILSALGLSLLLHIVICAALSVLNLIMPEAAFESLAPPKTIEVTIVAPPEQLTPVLAANPKTERRVLDTDTLDETTQAPKDAVFESDKNTAAASESASVGVLPMPSQNGRDLPTPHFNTQNYMLGKLGERAPEPEPAGALELTPLFQPTPIPVARPQDVAPRPAPLPRSPSKDDALAFNKPAARQSEKEVAQPTATPQQDATPAEAQQMAKFVRSRLRPNPDSMAKSKPRPGYRRQTEQTKIEGSISNRGKSSVDAVATPLGRYRKNIADAIGSRWYVRIKQRMDLISIGTVHIKFFIKENGQVENVKILSNSGNETLGNSSLESIMDADIPPIPADMAEKLEDGRMEIEYSFTIYPS